MKKISKNLFFTILRFAPLAICAVFMCVYLLSGEEITAENLLNLAPEEPLFAAIFLVLLYAFKSLTIFFPIIILNVLGGFLFEPIHALIINSIGMVVEIIIPYWIGRVSGTSLANRLYEKQPKLRELVGERSGNSLFVPFFLRVISCLPADVIGMYLGAKKVPFWPCLVGSFLGTLPRLVTSTLLGMNITDPSSPMFWVSIGLTAGISAISFLAYYLWKRRKKAAG